VTAPPPLTVWPLPGLPEVRPGDDLAGLLLAAVGAAGLELADGDVLAVTSKVVAKAEGRLVPLPDDPAGRDRVHAETVAAETVRVVARRGRLVITETRQGPVGANALVDASNAGGDQLVLLPADPDASAARLRAAVGARCGRDVAVVVTDTLGRPWRLGQTDVAVGLAGMGPLEDWRGRPDGDGRLLEVTEVAVADEVAAAADLVKGKASRVPAALLRGVPRPKGDGRARDLARPPAEDLFRTAGTAADLLAFLEGGAAPGRLLPDPVDRQTVMQAVRTAATAARRLRVVVAASPGARAVCLPGVPAGLAEAPVLLVPCLAEEAQPPPDAAGDPDPLAGGEPDAGLAGGAAVRTLLLGLHAQGLAGAVLPLPPGLAAALRLPAGWRPLGLIAGGRADPLAAAGQPVPPEAAEVLLRR
jgi:coenzyme F420-0:L-glutamate ligase / coenzyme F420-1:gamma-L-glutamate ligase